MQIKIQEDFLSSKAIIQDWKNKQMCFQMYKIDFFFYHHKHSHTEGAPKILPSERRKSIWKKGCNARRKGKQINKQTKKNLLNLQENPKYCPCISYFMELRKNKTEIHDHKSPLAGIVSKCLMQNRQQQ